MNRFFNLNRRIGTGLIIAAVVVLLVTGGPGSVDWWEVLAIVGIAALAGVLTGFILRFALPLEVRMRAARTLRSKRTAARLRSLEDRAETVNSSDDDPGS